MNFPKEMTGGDCHGGFVLRGLGFIAMYGLPDESCAPYYGLNSMWGMEVRIYRD